MKRFAALVEALTATRSTARKTSLVADYFGEAEERDAAWALHLLAGGRLERTLGPSQLLEEVSRLAGLPAWLLSASFAATGDLAEALAHVLEPRCGSSPAEPGLGAWLEEELLPLAGAGEEARRAALARWVEALAPGELFLAFKALTGALRCGVSRGLALRGLAQAAGLERASLNARLTGWEPTPGRAAAQWRELLDPSQERAPSQPYPFYLASPLEAPEGLGDPGEWLVEWKWDGVRAQLLARAGQRWLWSRGEEEVSARFPEVVEAARGLPEGCVLDGELLAFHREGPPSGGLPGAPLPFGVLQQRLGRKAVPLALRQRAPVVFVAFDLLEEAGADLRERPLRERRERLGALLGGGELLLSPALAPPDWEAAAALQAGARAEQAEGLMLKRLDSPYRAGRLRGDWWKWKVEPLRIDAVLTHAQPGSGRRATLLTDYTFGVWRGEGEARELVTLAKAYSGLSDAEVEELDRRLRREVVERYGPVRALEPRHVFELACDSLQRASRRGAGLSLRFPRIARWRRDKRPEDADTLARVRALLPPEPELPEAARGPAARPRRRGRREAPGQLHLFPGL